MRRGTWNYSHCMLDRLAQSTLCINLFFISETYYPSCSPFVRGGRHRASTPPPPSPMYTILSTVVGLVYFAARMQGCNPDAESTFILSVKDDQPCTVNVLNILHVGAIPSHVASPLRFRPSLYRPGHDLGELTRPAPRKGLEMSSYPEKKHVSFCWIINSRLALRCSA